jgi:hypothetical protein
VLVLVLVLVLDGAVSPEPHTCLLDCLSFVSTLYPMSTPVEFSITSTRTSTRMSTSTKKPSRSAS